LDHFPGFGRAVFMRAKGDTCIVFTGLGKSYLWPTSDAVEVDNVALCKEVKGFFVKKAGY
jgi:hypothetical protein